MRQGMHTNLCKIHLSCLCQATQVGADRFHTESVTLRIPLEPFHLKKIRLSPSNCRFCLEFLRCNSASLFPKSCISSACSNSYIQKAGRKWCLNTFSDRGRKRHPAELKEISELCRICECVVWSGHKGMVCQHFAEHEFMVTQKKQTDLKQQQCMIPRRERCKSG